jgi:hypothetical protein
MSKRTGQENRDDPNPLLYGAMAILFVVCAAGLALGRVLHHFHGPTQGWLTWVLPVIFLADAVVFGRRAKRERARQSALDRLFSVEPTTPKPT